MPFPQDLFPCTFRGAEWFLSNADTGGGRKTSTKSIVNSDRQVVEDLGLRQRSFTLGGTIAARRSNDGTEILSYQDVKDRFLEAVEAPGVGVLVHPFFGRIENLQVTTFTLNESTTRLGSASVSVTFAVSNTDGLPQATAAVLDTVVTASAAADTALENAVAEDLSVFDKFAGNFQDAVSKVEDVVAAVKAATDPIAQLAQDIDRFNKGLQDLAADAASLVDAPQELAESIRSSVESINALFATPVAIFDSMTRLFDFGDLDINFSADTRTAGGQQRQQNRDLLNTQIQGTALSQAYANAAQLDVVSVEDLETVQSLLEDQYQKMVEQDVWDSGSQNALTETRIVLTEFFEAQRATLPRRTTVTINTIPARVLAFAYYEDSTRGDQIAQFNGVDDAAFVEGEIEILTS